MYPKYKYSQTWFLDSEIKSCLNKFLNPDAENHILEIGCFEGLSSVFFADHYIGHPRSSLTCVDPFMSLSWNDHSQYLTNNEEGNFDHNISACANVEKITVQKITSDMFFETCSQTFNFVYIDGCHEPDFIERDMENGFKVVRKNGIMWMDDYMGGKGGVIKNTMDKFLEKHEGEYECIHRGYQLAVRKI